MPLVISGATSGQTTIQATDAVTATITLPSTSGTVQVSGSAGSFTSLTSSALTSGRITFASTGGLLADSSALTFNGTQVAIENVSNTSYFASGAATNIPSGNALFTFNNNTAAADKFNGITVGALGGTSAGQYAYFGAVTTASGFSPNMVFGVRTASASYTERMRIDASGRIVSGGDIYLGGAGVYTASEAAIVYNSNGDLILSADPNNISASSNLICKVDSTEHMRLDSSGNLGLGVTPSAWGNTWKTIQIGTSGAIGFVGGANLILSNNTYTTLTDDIYIQTSAAAKYLIATGGIHRWSSAPSGTAGTAATFTERMTLDNSGNLGIGTTSPTQKLDVVASGAATGIRVATTSSHAAFLEASSNTATVRTRLQANITDAFTGTLSNHDFFIQTNGAERARITAAGEVYIAGTTDRGAFNLQCNGTGVWGAGAYTNGSDERIKNNIEPLATGLDVVAKLNPVTYKYNEDWSKDQSTQTGFIAQELLTALDGKNYVDGIVNQSSEYMSVAYQNIIPILTKAIQELKAIVDTQAEQIKALQGAA